jgi:hypothetical protein
MTKMKFLKIALSSVGVLALSFGIAANALADPAFTHFPNNGLGTNTTDKPNSGRTKVVSSVLTDRDWCAVPDRGRYYNIGSPYRVESAGRMVDNNPVVFGRRTTDGLPVMVKQDSTGGNCVPTAFAGLGNIGVGSDWKIVGSGRFNADAGRDLYWYNSSNGQIAIWNTSTPSATITSQTVVDTNTSLDYVAQAVGDFNGDGQGDMFFRSNATGGNVIWYANGQGAFVKVNLSGSSPAYATLTNQNWQVFGSQDTNLDGRDDLMWRDYGNGQIATWRMTTGLGVVQEVYTYPQTIPLGDKAVAPTVWP